MDVVLLVIAKLIFNVFFIFDNLIIGGRGNLKALGLFGRLV